MIYLDNAGTTRPFDEVIEICNKIYSEYYFNPSATYYDAVKVSEMLAKSRKIIADELHCQPEEIIFTSCATESDNWALEYGAKSKNGNIVISAGEHAAIYEEAMKLKNKGREIRIAPLNSDGRVDLEKLNCLIDENTALVSIIHCSNETGAVNDIREISKIIKSKSKAVFHSDGVQAFCKIPVNLNDLGVDLYSISGHKIGAPKGIGALYVKKGININPMIVGGGQERGMRSGTENTAGIISFGKAVEVFNANYDKDKIKKMRSCILDTFKSIGNVIINAEKCENSNFIISASVLGIKAEILQNMLYDDNVIIGLGSACSAKTSENRVLSNLGRTKKEIEGNIRISLFPTLTQKETEEAMDKITKKINILRGKI